jgi:hypothetical protein
MVADGGGLGILVIDIVNFRPINELYGDPVGDAVISAVANELKRPLTRPHHCPLRRRRVRHGHSLLERRSQRDLARTGRARCWPIDYPRKPRGQLRDSERHSIRSDTESTRFAARERFEQVDVDQAKHPFQIGRSQVGCSPTTCRQMNC